MEYGEWVLRQRIRIQSETQHSIIPILQYSSSAYSNTPSLQFYNSITPIIYSARFAGGRNIRLKPADVISARPKIANDSP
jgi:hypothetical protein